MRLEQLTRSKLGNQCFNRFCRGYHYAIERFSFGVSLARLARMAHVGDARSSTLTDFKPETLRGTPGFFRVGQTRRGQWWLIDSRDRPFLSKGVASVNRFGRGDGRSVPVGPYATTVDK